MLKRLIIEYTHIPYYTIIYPDFFGWPSNIIKPFVLICFNRDWCTRDIAMMLLDSRGMEFIYRWAMAQPFQGSMAWEVEHQVTKDDFPAWNLSLSDLLLILSRKSPSNSIQYQSISKFKSLGPAEAVWDGASCPFPLRQGICKRFGRWLQLRVLLIFGQSVRRTVRMDLGWWWGGARWRGREPSLCTWWFRRWRLSNSDVKRGRSRTSRSAPKLYISDWPLKGRTLRSKTLNPTCWSRDNVRSSWYGIVFVFIP